VTVPDKIQHRRKPLQREFFKDLLGGRLTPEDFTGVEFTGVDFTGVKYAGVNSKI
jgi:uncharacterized protein YjbI with pentapeptide repeats